MASICPSCQAETRVYLDYQGIGKGDYQLRRCPSCRLIYTEPLPAPEFLESFYQSYDSFGAQDNYYHDLKNYRLTPAGRELVESFNKIEAEHHLDKSLSVLDLGSGGGAFLDILKQRGYRALGVEISRPAAAFAQKQFGVEVINESVEEVALEPDNFGSIFMWDLLEHLREPQTVIGKANRWLKKGGYLIIETPNSRALINKIIIILLRVGIKWPAAWMFGYHHLYWYSRESLIKLLAENHFKIVEISKDNTLASRIFTWRFKYCLPRLALEAVNVISKVLGEQNKLLVVAQKI